MARCVVTPAECDGWLGSATGDSKLQGRRSADQRAPRQPAKKSQLSTVKTPPTVDYCDHHLCALLASLWMAFSQLARVECAPVSHGRGASCCSFDIRRSRLRGACRSIAELPRFWGNNCATEVLFRGRQ